MTRKHYTPEQIILIIFSIALIVNCGGGKKEKTEAKAETHDSHTGHSHAKSADPADKMTEAEDLVYYTCPMDVHPDQYSSDPGHYPKCGMDFSCRSYYCKR